MNAKERAQYLIELFNFIVLQNDYVTTNIRRLCALKMVDEKLSELDFRSRDALYWMNVKQILLDYEMATFPAGKIDDDIKK